MRTEVVRDDALDTRFLRSSEQRTLRVQNIRMYSGNQYVGAREQLMKLDLFPGFVAVFLLGFGADTVKNLITRNMSNGNAKE